MKTYLDSALRFPYQLYNKKENNNTEIQQKFIKEAFQVAAEEAKHFNLLDQRLQQLSEEQNRPYDSKYFYGFMPVINQIRQNAICTKQFLHQRLAITSMIQEGKGVDAGDRLLQKLMLMEEKEGAKILKLILKEEVGHIKFGRVWFEQYCQNNNINIQESFNQITEEFEYSAKATKQFNRRARVKAGFDENWFSQVFQTTMQQASKKKKHQEQK